MRQESEQLKSTIDSAEPKLRAVSEDRSREPILQGGWSRKQIIGHLIDSASNNHQRFVRATLQESLDFPGYDQKGCVQVAGVQDLAWTDLLNLWTSYNRFLAHVIARLPEDSLEKTCRVGANQPVTLGFLVTDYLTHLNHHLAQLGAY